MEKLLIFIIIMYVSDSLPLPNEPLNTENSGVIKRDVSYSYAATDIGSHEGVHVKTLTVIKNIEDKPKKDKVTTIVQLDEKHKIDIPDIPQISEELLSEFNIFLKHEYVPKTDEKHTDKKGNNSETNKASDETINAETNSRKEEFSNEGTIPGEDLLNVNAEEIKETNENVTSEKLKPSDDFTSSPILPEQAERSAQAQKDRYQANPVKTSDKPKELFTVATKIEEHFEENKKYEPQVEKLFEPNNDKKSEPLLLHVPISFDGIPPPSSDKTVFPRKTTYNKKTFQTSASPGLGFRRVGNFIPKFSNLNYTPIKK